MAEHVTDKRIEQIAALADEIRRAPSRFEKSFVVENLADGVADLSGVIDRLRKQHRNAYLVVMEERDDARNQLRAETAIAKDLLQRNVELGTRADNAEAARDDLREQLAAANGRAEKAERAIAIEKARCASAEKLMAADHKRAETAEAEVATVRKLQTASNRQHDEAMAVAEAKADELIGHLRDQIVLLRVEVANMHPDREALVDDAIAAHEENDRLTIEARELRARLDGLGELAGELHNAETQNADAVAAWSAAEDLRAATPRSRRGSDACLAASKQLNEAQARLCAAQDAWAGAVAGFRSDGGPT